MAEPSVAQLFLDSTAKSIATAQANNGMGGLGAETSAGTTG